MVLYCYGLMKNYWGIIKVKKTTTKTKKRTSKTKVKKIENFDVFSENNIDIAKRTKEAFEKNRIDKNDPNVCYFSVPMPFDKKVIDYIASVNKEYKKCKIGTFLNNMPSPFSARFNEWFQVNRGTNEEIVTFEQFGEVAAYAKSKGFDVCYLMNSPKPFSENDFGYIKNHLYPLLEVLKKYGIDYIKFANTQVGTVINYVAPGYRLSSSTAGEYHTITQFKYLLQSYPNIEFIDMTSEENHNFKLLKNIKKLFPNVRIEIMVNEACLSGCPARISHASELRFCMFDCNYIRRKIGTALDFCKSPVVYPWHIEEYLKMGINNFKIIPSHGEGMRGNYKSIFPVLNYMDCIEHGLEGISANRFFRNTYMFTLDNESQFVQLPETVMLSEIKELLPDVKYFVKNGYKCATSCGVDCTYCYNCAEKLEKFILKKGGVVGTKMHSNIIKPDIIPVHWGPTLDPLTHLGLINKGPGRKLDRPDRPDNNCPQNNVGCGKGCNPCTNCKNL